MRRGRILFVGFLTAILAGIAGPAADASVASVDDTGDQVVCIDVAGYGFCVTDPIIR